MGRPLDKRHEAAARRLHGGDKSARGKFDQLMHVVDSLRCEVRGDVTRRESGVAEGSPAMLGPDIRQRPETSVSARQAQAHRGSEEAAVNSAGSSRTKSFIGEGRAQVAKREWCEL